MLETDPAKYVYTYNVFSKILQSYSSDVQMKSVDEGVIDFSTLQLITKHSLVSIGQEIITRLKQQLGEWMTCNVGIAPNRFLAKLAASLHKPDGLDVLTHQNLLATYEQLELVDLSGINRRYKARLNAAGIFTPLDLFAATEQFLSKQVFKSINGYYWFLRLRGWEVDARALRTRTVGKQYVLHEATNDIQKLRPIIMKMCEMMGRRLRSKDLCGRGLAISCWLQEGGYWHKRQTFKTRLFSTQDLFSKVMELFNQRPEYEVIKTLTVTTYCLLPATTSQVSLFETKDMQRWRLTETIDAVNDRYGEFSIMPAAMAYMDSYVPQKIPFGSTRYFKTAAIG